MRCIKNSGPSLGLNFPVFRKKTRANGRVDGGSDLQQRNFEYRQATRSSHAGWAVACFRIRRWLFFCAQVQLAIGRSRFWKED